MSLRKPNTPLHALQALFRRKLAATLDDLRRVLRTTSRTTVFRVLSKAGYFTSFSHAGRYYTLAHIPKFDDNDLWFFDDVGFSRQKTLRATIVALVRKAPAGCTHDELALILGLRVHDTLLALVKKQLLERERIDGVYVYFDTDSVCAAAQRQQRRYGKALVARPPPPLRLPQVIEILLTVITTPRAEATAVAAHLRAAGSDISEEQVQTVFAHYGLEKKTAHSRSPRWRRSGATSPR